MQISEEHEKRFEKTVRIMFTANIAKNVKYAKNLNIAKDYKYCVGNIPRNYENMFFLTR